MESKFKVKFLPRDKDIELREIISDVIQTVSDWTEIATAVRYGIGDPTSESNLLCGGENAELFEVVDALMPKGKESREQADTLLGELLAGTKRPADIVLDLVSVVNSESVYGGFYLGQLFGARLAGASDAQMKKLGAALFRHMQANHKR